MSGLRTGARRAAPARASAPPTPSDTQALAGPADPGTGAGDTGSHLVDLLARFGPIALAAVLAAAYVLISPPSLDLAAHMFRAWLFSREPFGIWNNYWYSGHHIVGYSLLYPAASAALTPQLAAALAATGTAILFDPLVRRHFGERAWLGSLVFAASTATNLFTGRLAFAFGAFPGMAAVLALDRRRTWLACLLAIITALSSPVAALFVAVAGGAYALGRAWPERRPPLALPGCAVALCALAPVGLIAIAFPEGGTEPYVFNAFLPIPLLGIGALLVIPRERITLRAGVALYTLGTLASYLVPTAVGSNAGRLGTWVAAPLAALVWWRRRMLLLAVAALPLLYLEWHDSVRDLTTASSDPSHTAGYYQPLLHFLEHRGGPPFRIEIPFTSFHWEAYAVASHFPIARGWERQLDIKDNPLFYYGKLTPARYERWLHTNAVRFVALASAPVDYSARAEKRLILHGLSYLHLVMRSANWRVYAVQNATPIAQGVATLTGLGPDWLTFRARSAGSVYLHVHFTPYWELTEGSGCVEPAGAFTRLQLRRPGPVRLVTEFSIWRIAATSPRCT